MRAVKSTHTDTNSAFQNERQKVACNELPETPRRLWCHHEPSDIAQVLHTIADISCHQAYGNDVGFICSKLKIYKKKTKKTQNFIIINAIILRKQTKQPINIPTSSYFQ